jgi:hypothetical protein
MNSPVAGFADASHRRKETAMSDKIQPSGDYLATCAAVAYEIVERATVSPRPDAITTAKLVRRAFLIIAKGVEHDSPDTEKKK